MSDCSSGWPKLLWFVTESKHLSKPPRDWFPHIKDANNDTAYIEVSSPFSSLSFPSSLSIVSDPVTYLMRCYLLEVYHVYLLVLKSLQCTCVIILVQPETYIDSLSTFLPVSPFLHLKPCQQFHTYLIINMGNSAFC